MRFIHRKISILFVLLITNLCSGAPVIDSSNGFDPVYPASNSIDGIYGNSNMAWGRYPTSWIIYDFGENPQTISKFRITPPRYGGATSQTFNPTSGTIEFSDDKISWTTPISWVMPALESVGRTDYAEAALPAPVQKRYVRLTLPNVGRIGEIFFVESPQLAVWELAQNTTYTNSYPAINTCDGDPKTFSASVWSEGNIIYDQGKAKNIYGFRIISRFIGPPSQIPTSGALYVSDSPDSGWTSMGTWTLPALEYGTAGNVIFTTPQSKRYIKLTKSSGGTQWADLEILNYPIVLDSTPNMAIIIPDGITIANPDTFICTDGSVLFAAKELRYHIKKMTDGAVSLGIYNESSKPAGYQYIYLGNCSATAAAGISSTGLDKSECIIRCEDGDLYICGDDTVRNYNGNVLGSGTSAPYYIVNNLNHIGTLLGVYDLLKNNLNIRWLWPGETGEKIPQQSSIILPAIRKTVIPKFAFSRLRDGIYSSVDYTGWSNQSSFNDFMNAQQLWLRRQGFVQNMYMDIGHSYTTWWDTYGTSNPEWFNLLPDNTRTYDYGSKNGAHISMCWSNSNMQAQKAANWYASRNSYPWLNGSENDTNQKCMCAACRGMDYYDSGFDPDMSETDWNNRVTIATDAFDNQEANWELYMGSMSDRFAQYLSELQNTATNNYSITPEMTTGMAYANYRRPPVSSIQLNNQILIGFVPNIMFPWTSTLRTQMLDEIDGWKNTGARVGFRPNFLFTGHNYPIFIAEKYGNDITSLYTTGNGLFYVDFDGLTGQFGSQALNLYMIGRMNTDVDFLNTNMILEEFYSAFGPARDEVKDYFSYLKTVSDSITDTSYSWGGFFRQAYVNWDSTIRANMRAKMDAAIDAAAGDADATAKVEFLNDGLLHIEKSLSVVEAWYKWVDGTQVEPDASDGFNTLVMDLDEFRLDCADNNIFISNFYFLRSREDVLWYPGHRTAEFDYKVLPFWFPVTGSGSGINTIGVLYDDNLFPMPGTTDHFRITNISGADLYVVLSLNASCPVSEIRYTNRTDCATNYNVRDLEIYVMPSENEADKYRVSAYTQQVFNDRPSPDSNAAGVLRSADITNVNRRYFLIKIKSNFWGNLSIDDLKTCLFDGHDFDIVTY